MTVPNIIHYSNVARGLKPENVPFGEVRQNEMSSLHHDKGRLTQHTTLLLVSSGTNTTANLKILYWLQMTHDL